jgi:hypothetical protein
MLHVEFYIYAILVYKHFQDLCVWYKNYDYYYWSDTIACVGKLLVEPFQAHGENIFNESGGTSKNVAIL